MSSDIMDIKNSQSRFMKILTVSLISVVFLSTQSFSAGIETGGRVESRIGMLGMDGTGDGSNLVHMERINWGIQQQYSFLNLNYSLSGGGIIRGSNQYAKTQIVPEFQAKARMIPFGKVALELFSYSQLRNPMQIAQDSLQHKEQVSGVQLSSALPRNGRLVMAYGYRSSSKHHDELNHQFMKLQLEQKALGLQFRIRGEKDLFSNALADDEDYDRSNMSIHWYGSPIKGLNWSASNSVYSYGGDAYWRIYQRLNYKLSNRSTVWSHLSNQQAAYKGSYLNTQKYDVDYRWKMNDKFALQLLGEGSKVRPVSGDPVYHWRAYLAGLHWRLGNKASALGVLQAGYKESYRFGSGIDARFELEERIPLLQRRTLSIGLNDHASGEFFIRLDSDGDDPKYDIDHELDLAIDLWPGQKFQIGNSFRLINHFGADLDFSMDTLRNAVTHNIQFKFIERKLRASLDHLTISDLGDNNDLRLHLNTRFSYHLTPGSSMNLISMYRYQSEMYPDYVWLNSFLKVNMQYFSWALEVQAQGTPEQVFDDNYSVWMRFMRQL